MILFFKTTSQSIIVTDVSNNLEANDIEKLSWLYGDAQFINEQTIEGYFVGPRKEMVTPWSTNAVEITQNMNLSGILRIEEFFPVDSEDANYDPMLQTLYRGLTQNVFEVNHQAAPIKYIDDLDSYNKAEGLLSDVGSATSSTLLAVSL